MAKRSGNNSKKTQELTAENLGNLGRASNPHWPKNSSIFIPDERLENLKAYRYSGTDKSLVSVCAFFMFALKRCHHLLTLSTRAALRSRPL